MATTSDWTICDRMTFAARWPGTLDARGVPLQDIRVVLRHETLTATQSYLVDNPLRVDRTMSSFTIALSPAS